MPSNGARSDFTSDLETVQRKFLQIFGRSIETVLSQGPISIEDDPRNERSSVAKIDTNVDRDLVRLDHRLTVRMIGAELNLNYTTVHSISDNELGMRKIC